MEKSGKDFFSQRVIISEMFAFALIITIIWLDEFVDIPALVLGAEKTPANWRESLFETLLITSLAIIIIYYTRTLFARMRFLEGLLPICSSCKKIHDEDGKWREMESYIQARSAARFSHGLCPHCAKKLYPEVFALKGSSDTPRGEKI